MIYNNDTPVIKTFMYDEKYFLYDAFSNFLFEVSRELFAELKCLQKNGFNYYINSQRNTKEYDAVMKLIKKGVIGRPCIETIEHPETNFVNSLTERFVNDMTFQVTRECNFNCRYCAYANNNSIGRNHEQINMSFDVAQKGLLFLYEHSLDSTLITIGFYGGEPMINFPLIKEIVECAEKLFYSKKIIYRMTINGSILTDEMLAYMVEHDFIIVISLDGSEMIQNKHRKFCDSGKGTFHTVYHNVMRIKNRFYKYFNENVSFMSVVLEGENPHEVLDFFEKAGIPEHSVKLMSADLSGVDYAKGDINIEIEDNPIDKTFYDRMIKIYNSKKTIQKDWHHCGQCIPSIRSLFVNVYGDFYPCEKLIECPNLSIGNIESGLNIQKIVDFLNIGNLTEADCKHCWAMRFCEICIAQCFDPEKGNITVEAKRMSCEKQKQKTLYFFKKLIDEKYHKNNRG